jgi:hydroxyacylglutathione hydrolase
VGSLFETLFRFLTTVEPMGEQTPKIVELRPNLYQIPAVRPGSHVYLIKGRWKNVLIDSGMAAGFPVVQRCLAEVGLRPQDIHLIILTHEHFDHIGATAVSFDTAVVAAHRFAANKIQLQDEFVMMNKYFDLPARPLHADVWLEGNTRIELGNFSLSIIHTPGHCSGCISLYESVNRLLFTGDTVLAGGLLSDVCPSGSIGDYVNSLERLNTLNARELYPGHGRISTTPAADLQEALRKARDLLEESKILFEALDTKATFKRLFAAARRYPTSKEPNEDD